MGGGGRVFTNLASKVRCVTTLCSRNTDMALGKASRNMHPSLSSGSCSPSTLQGRNRRLSSYLLRLPNEVACTQSLLPMYSVTAAARLVSQLSTNTGAGVADLHGTLTHMSPDR